MPREAAVDAGLDAANARFWEELSGTNLAISIGLTGAEPDALERFDAAYFGIYPYLPPYLDALAPREKEILEIGLGYGSVGQYLLEHGANYFGLDIAAAPVRLMRGRAARLDKAVDQIVEGSALEIPWPESSFDAVVSIGCLHHTGDLARSVSEVHRVLRPGGAAVVMLYNKRSLRQLRAGRKTKDEIRAHYDANTAGEAAPHTDFVSRRDVRALFSSFATTRIRSRNMDPLVVRGRIVATRKQLLGTLDRVLGLDLYIVASKSATE